MARSMLVFLLSRMNLSLPDLVEPKLSFEQLDIAAAREEARLEDGGEMLLRLAQVGLLMVEAHHLLERHPDGAADRLRQAERLKLAIAYAQRNGSFAGKRIRYAVTTCRSGSSLRELMVTNQARNLMHLGRVDRAEPILERAGLILANSIGRDHPRFALWQLTRAEWLIASGDASGARRLAEEAESTIRIHFGATSPEVRRMTSVLSLASESKPTGAGGEP